MVQLLPATESAPIPLYRIVRRQPNRYTQHYPLVGGGGQAGEAESLSLLIWLLIWLRIGLPAMDLKLFARSDCPATA